MWTALLAPGLPPFASVAEKLQKMIKFLQQITAR
jgi:hypothetical protein